MLYVFLVMGSVNKFFCDENSFKDLKLFRIAMAGATSGLFTTPILAPLERLKCVLQVQNAKLKAGEKAKFQGPIDLGKHLYKEGGIASVFRGFWSTMLRDSVASMAYFSSYEYLKRKLNPEGSSPDVFKTLFAGGVAGICNWLPAIPIDTLKSRLQTAEEGRYKHGIRSVFSEIYQKEGANTIRILYRGIGPVMIRAFPANAACFLGYETAMRFLNFVWP
eukprot:TRINITY_DN1637_c0_g1_i3.p1 TRINITY_DN1637_c0_g1~~TRINITY_DN1637_c0_g1_i3.p1  ORF type:complete len:220 (-),score=33.92 TRINITY_DN1637_c0_g1_i3:160-819(-)